MAPLRRRMVMDGPVVPDHSHVPIRPKEVGRPGSREEERPERARIDRRTFLKYGAYAGAGAA